MRWYDLPSLLPPVYYSIKSMHAVADTENTELLSAKSAMESMLDNFFIQTCDVQTLEYWESLIGIKLYGDETIDGRRSMVMLYLANDWQITKPYVTSIMDRLFGHDHYTFEYSAGNNLSVEIRMYDVTTNAIRRFIDFFTEVCPAHVEWGTYHTENSQSTNYISACTESHYSVSSECAMSTGSGTLYLGGTAYTVPWVELS